MCDLIEHECEKAERDLFAACRQSLAHGALLATRYVLAEIDFNAGREEGRAARDKLKVRISNPTGPPIALQFTRSVRLASRRRRRNPGSLY